jgi:hypothetical protein
MGILGTVWFMLVILPGLILKEGFDMFMKLMNERNWWWKLPYFLLTACVILLIVLLAAGYR